ncbi:MAG: glycosyltransferase, partial [Verrucomicrobiota bacterium]|nr:glycosyltransferase [Verrucomicrobiota bacterium]
IRELKRIPANLRGRKHRPVPKLQAQAPDKIVDDRYARWIAEHEPDAAGLAAQRVAATRLTSRPKISLLLLIHDTPPRFLRELRASLTAQTYDNFEICAVDAASKNVETRTFLEEWKKEEARLRLEVLPENFGIAENTNRALASATGDYIVCVDHDDLLPPFALYQLARAINKNPNGEIFYSDEDRLGADGKRHSPFFKPEWNPELLLSFMYMGHLTAYRRDLVERVGKFREEFDFSQDYDLALRATELAREIVHVPHVLYHWREHPASGSAGGKPHARKSNLAALEDAMKRRGLAAEIMAYPTANRARLKVSPWPKVSIVVPTDSAVRGKACVEELPRLISYPDLEIVIVTNSLLVEALESLTSARSGFRFVRYDEPFNFSKKCNLGAAAASGTCLIFLNDDVAVAEADWIQNLIEPLENSQVGGVSPKLLYADGRIQHAGLVTGVRELVGTACHQWPGDSTDYFNFAQSLRAASALSAACLAMRRDDFFSVGQFDAINTPVAHSDFDLSFKIRAAGMRCVYTPFVSMTHRGHESIGVEGEEKKMARAERPSIFLLKRWPGYAGHDPYFPDNMRDWLYADSPTPIRISVPNEYKSTSNRADLLFVSHDLSLSGAPMMLFHAALWCRNHGDFVVVTAPTAGPLAQKFEAEGIPLIIDPLVEAEHESYKRFAREFHCVIANTIFCAPAVRALAKENVPVAFWLHEPSSVGEHYMRADEKLRAALPQADVLIAPSAWTAAFYQPFNDHTAKCLRNAIPDFCRNGSSAEKAAASVLRILLLGSFESRKGQDIFAAAIALLQPDVLGKAQFQIAGRRLDPEFSRKLDTTAKGLPNLSIMGARDHAQALALLGDADVVVSASRDEAMPTVTILEAMCLGKAIVATAVGGAEEVMVNDENSLLVRPEDPIALAAALQRVIENPALVRHLGAGARATYEKNFTIDRFGREFREIIDQTIRSRHSI